MLNVKYGLGEVPGRAYGPKENDTGPFAVPGARGAEAAVAPVATGGVGAGPACAGVAPLPAAAAEPGSPAAPPPASRSDATTGPRSRHAWRRVERRRGSSRPRATASRRSGRLTAPLAPAGVRSLTGNPSPSLHGRALHGRGTGPWRNRPESGTTSVGNAATGTSRSRRLHPLSTGRSARVDGDRMGAPLGAPPRVPPSSAPHGRPELPCGVERAWQRGGAGHPVASSGGSAPRAVPRLVGRRRLSPGDYPITRLRVAA